MTTQLFSINVPTDLLSQIETMAAENDRSRNGQIVYLLKKAVAAEVGYTPAPTPRRIRKAKPETTGRTSSK